MAIPRLKQLTMFRANTLTNWLLSKPTSPFLSTLSYDVDQLAKNWVERTNVDDFDQANKSYNSF